MVLSLDYPHLRSNFIEEQLLRPWCNSHLQSQIVLLGAGLDVRAYRFKPLHINHHIVFEIDFPNVIDFKRKLMEKEKPLCKIVRLSADLVDAGWSSHLIKNGYSREIPSFWILEGLSYYIEQDNFSSLITKTAEISKIGSQIFIDILPSSRGLPSESTSTTAAFPKHHKWGLNIKDIPNFFAPTGWEVSSSFVEENDHGRDDGQKGMIFIHGRKI